MSHTCEWVMSRMWMRHDTLPHIISNTLEWVMSYTWMSHVPFPHVMSHTCEWVTSRMWLMQVTFMTCLRHASDMIHIHDMSLTMNLMSEIHIHDMSQTRHLHPYDRCKWHSYGCKWHVSMSHVTHVTCVTWLIHTHWDKSLASILNFHPIMSNILEWVLW